MPKYLVPKDDRRAEYKSQFCDTCRGAGYIRDDCNDCDGDGYVSSSCSPCRGTGRMERRMSRSPTPGGDKYSYDTMWCYGCDGAGRKSKRCINKCIRGLKQRKCPTCRY